MVLSRPACRSLSDHQIAALRVPDTRGARARSRHHPEMVARPDRASFGERPGRPATPAPTSVQTNSDNVPVYVVVAPASKGLHIRFEPNAKSAIVATLHQGDRVFLNEGRVA
jgi:hypothetical protein